MDEQNLLDLPADILCLVLSKITDYTEIIVLEEKIPAFAPYFEKCTTAVNFTKSEVGKLYDDNYDLFKQNYDLGISYEMITDFIINHSRVKYYQVLLDYNDDNIDYINEPIFDIKARYLYLNVKISGNNGLYNLTKLFVDGVLLRYQKYGSNFSLSIYSDYVSLRYDNGILEFFSDLVSDNSKEEIKRLSDIKVDKVYLPSSEILDNISTDTIIIGYVDNLEYMEYQNIKHVIFKFISPISQVLTKKRIDILYNDGNRYPNILSFEYPVQVNKSNMEKLQVIFPSISKFYSWLYYLRQKDIKHEMLYKYEKGEYPKVLA